MYYLLKNTVVLGVFFSLSILPISVSIAKERNMCVQSLVSVDTEIESKNLLEGRGTIPIHQRSNGTFYVYIFPMVKTEVTFINSEPYITVYRGIRGKFDPQKPSGTLSDILLTEADELPLGDENSQFGNYMYTSLNPKVAVSYLTRLLSFVTPKYLTLLKMRLPLKMAYIAKRKKDAKGRMENRDEYLPALPNRKYIWFQWQAWDRMRERELVWNIDELGGSLLEPAYDLKKIVVPIEVDPGTGEQTNVEAWHSAAKTVMDAVKAEAWE